MKHATSAGVWRVITGLMLGALLLAACQPSAGPAPTAAVIRETVVVPQTQVVVETSVVRETQVVEITPTAPPATGPTLNPDVSGTVEMWHFWASPLRRNALQRVIGICQQKLPNIQVVDVVKPFGDLWTANVAAVAAGSGMPDVIVSDRPTLPRDAADGVYMDLQEWADRDNVTRDQFYGWAWDQAVYQDHVYGIPHETDVRVLFWNKDAFREVGLDPEKPPETWQELEAYADKLDIKNPDGTYKRIGFFPLWQAGFQDFWTRNNDAELIAPDGTIQINNPKAVETLDWIKSWVDRYGGWENLQTFNAQFQAPPNDNFMSGSLAMKTDIFGYNAALTFYGPQYAAPDGSKKRMEWGVAMLPHNEGAEPGDWSGGFSLSIPTGAKNAEAAWEFIKCATGEEGQASWARDTQAQPTNIAAAEDPALQGLPQWRVVDDALAVSTGGVFVPEYPNWGEQLDQRLDKVWTGELTSQEALDEAQAAVTDVAGPTASEDD